MVLSSNFLPQRVMAMTELKARIIKRYGNRKLYDTEGSRYVTLDEIARLIRSGEDVQIIDNQTKEDLTTVTLTQIILEEEKKNSRMPLGVLRKMIVDSSEQIGEFFTEKVAKPVQSLREEAGKKLGERVKKGEETYEDLLGHFKDWLSTSQRSMDDFQKKIDERIHSALEGMGGNKDMRGEFVELQKIARAFEERVEKLKNLIDKKPDQDSPPDKSDNTENK
jgi:polyhydroxyalkanoate synthesis repressor PhaR